MEKPVWFKFARYDHQQVWEWLVQRAPEVAEWWDGYRYSVQNKFTWPGPVDGDDIILLFENKDFSKRSIRYRLVEIMKEGEK